jgi:hypothetical protein
LGFLLQSFFLPTEQYPFPGRYPLAVSSRRLPPEIRTTRRNFRVLLPAGERHLPAGVTPPKAVALLEFCLSRVFSLRTEALYRTSLSRTTPMPLARPATEAEDNAWTARYCPNRRAG